MKHAFVLIFFLVTHSQIGFCQVPGTKLWEVSTPGHVYCSPAIGDDGTIYVGCDDDTQLYPNHGYFCSFSPQGATNWVLGLPGVIRSSPSIGPSGMVYVGCYNGELKIVDPTGSYVRAVTAGHILASPAIALNGTVYVVSISNYFNKVYAFTPEGNNLWVFTMGKVQFSTPDSNQFPSPGIGPDGKIYVGSLDGNLYAINPNGTTNWVFPLISSNGAPKSLTYASPAFGSDGTVYIAADNGVVYAIDQRGHTKWNVQLPRPVESSATVGIDGVIYFGSRWLDGQFYAVASDGTQKWSVPCGGISGSASIVSDGSMYVGTYADSRLHAFSSSGSELWSFTASDYIFTSPAIGLDGTIYLAAGNKLYALYGTNSLLQTEWATFRGNSKHTARSVQRGLQGPALLPDGTTELTLIIETGRTYAVEYSTNLVDWLQLTNFVSDSTSNRLIDSNEDNSGRRFYRLATPR